MEIKWSKHALNQLAEILDFIEGNGFDSYAIELEDSIIGNIERLADNPLLYSADRYKINNDGSWHAFEIDNYRISYRILKSNIRIIRIRHTSRRPKIF